MRRPHLRRAVAGRPSRRIAAIVALLAATAVVVGVVAGAGSSSPKSSNLASSASGATTVARRDLVETDTESGTLSYADPQTVYDRLSGTITWLPSVGQVIKAGQPLFKVGGDPAILMDGSTPAYRDLTPSDSAGGDILELNRNLVDLGFNPDGISVDDTWQAATTAGIDALQASLGETQTGRLALGKVVFLPGAQLISTVDATLGSTGGSSNPPAANASDPAPANRPEFVSLQKPLASTHRKGHKQSKVGELQALIALLKAEIAELKAGKGSPSSGNATNSGSSSSATHGGGGGASSGGGSGAGGSGGRGSSGDAGGGSASEILKTTSTRLIVTVDLDASKQSEAKVGEPVTVEMPAGATVDGRITAVSAVAQSSSNDNNGNNGPGSGNGNSGSSSGSTIPVTIGLSGHQAGPGLDQAAVSVNFSQARANNVLSVPVTALLATGPNGYAVQEAAAPHNLIPVTTGLFAAGYVQISGPGVYEGLQVTDSQG